jgi:hypothetical protein
VKEWFVGFTVVVLTLAAFAGLGYLLVVVLPIVVAAPLVIGLLITLVTYDETKALGRNILRGIGK